MPVSASDPSVLCGLLYYSMPCLAVYVPFPKPKWQPSKQEPFFYDCFPFSTLWFYLILPFLCCSGENHCFLNSITSLRLFKENGKNQLSQTQSTIPWEPTKPSTAVTEKGLEHFLAFPSTYWFVYRTWFLVLGYELVQNVDIKQKLLFERQRKTMNCHPRFYQPGIFVKEDKELRTIPAHVSAHWKFIMMMGLRHCKVLDCCPRDQRRCCIGNSLTKLCVCGGVRFVLLLLLYVCLRQDLMQHSLVSHSLCRWC